MRLKCFLIFSLLCIQVFSFAATTYPYGDFIMKVPAQEDPFPGMGGGFVSLSKGIDTVLYNPASLTKSKGSEISVGIASTAAQLPYNKNYEAKDITFEATGGALSGFSNAILFTSDLGATVPATREFTGKLNCSTVSTGISYKQSIKVADIFSLGVITRGETGAVVNLAGNFPTQWKTDIALQNVSSFMGSGLSVNSAGKLTYKYTPAGMSTYTYTSEASVWSGFLSQTQRIPMTVISDSHNDINVNSNLTFASAAKLGSFSLGANCTPISATANIQNSMRAIVNDGTGDIYFYVPNFDPNNETDVLQWTTDPNKFANSSGYKKRYFRTPAGETIAEAKYNGFFTASGTRIDLGGLYEMNDFFTIGIAYENIGGTVLNFTGTGRVAFVNTRITSMDASNLIDPAATSFTFFDDNFSSVSGTENYGMQESIPVSLPKKVKIGASLKRPFTIAIDYEQQENPINCRYQKSDASYASLVLSDLKFLKGGFETQLFSLPLIIKGGLTLIFKPTVAGADANLLSTIDKAFKYKVLPTKIDLGTSLNLWGTELGNSFGASIMPAFSVLQLDTVGQDFSRLGYFSLFVKRDFWELTYLSILDPAATGAAYSSAENKNDYINIAKFINTLTFSVRF
ncbi:MAG: hypothetical protein FD145_492 [Candidatus Saganbacteria bacterium]|uniref:DUF5723 domain-containing protein n=1 Tax=Candidatus Saganbacteria bacterium TaxID=2575572 RepID=A0A833L1N8_UNCSA|nr:MAG: hypothetical protein FD145_492 [Candidatus Saganbacteria bacterium]